MDIETIDRNYEQLQKEAQDTIQALTALAGKLQAASDKGDQNAREWMLDLKEVALSIQEEENQATALLQAIHDFIVNNLQAPPEPAYQQPPPPQPAYQAPPVYQQAPAYPQQAPASPQQGGGMLSRLTGSGFGRAIVTGAGFGIGADIINSIFN